MIEISSLMIITCLLIVSIINFSVGYRIGMRRSLKIIEKELEDWNEL